MEAVLRLANLRIRRDGSDILRGISIDVRPGELFALMGASGSGKTTTLRAAAALEPFDEGSITIAGEQLRPGPLPRQSELRKFRKGIGLVFQAHALFEHMTALENVALAPVHVHGVDSAAADARARMLLDGLGVAHRADAYPRQLSGGESQRVAMARALAMDPPVLLLDEPTAALDADRRQALGKSLRQLAKDGRAILIATHDHEFVRDFADHMAVLSNGVLTTGSAAAPRSSGSSNLL